MDSDLATLPVIATRREEALTGLQKMVAGALGWIFPEMPTTS